MVLKLVIVAGTRPEIIRLSNTINLTRKIFDTTLIHTGQNWDKNLNDVFFRRFEHRKTRYIFGLFKKKLLFYSR